MSIQTDLQTVTAELSNARRAVADLEALRLLRRRGLSEVEADLSTARIMLMARSDAGTNDAARRAYAERETTAERAAVRDTNRVLVEAEIDLLQAQTRLRIIEDRRRYLEALVTLTTSRPAEIAIHASHADNGDRDPIGVLPTLNDDDETEMPF